MHKKKKKKVEVLELESLDEPVEVPKRVILGNVTKKYAEEIVKSRKNSYTDFKVTKNKDKDGDVWYRVTAVPKKPLKRYQWAMGVWRIKVPKSKFGWARDNIKAEYDSISSPIYPDAKSAKKSLNAFKKKVNKLKVYGYLGNR
jgi:hypothetical protein